MEKVMTTTEFVFWIKHHRTEIQAKKILQGEGPLPDYFFLVIHYAELMLLPLELGMFVPCVDGKPIEEPEGYKKWVKDGFPPISNVDKKADYDQAILKVLFEGYEIYKGVTEYYSIQLVGRAGNTTIGHWTGELETVDWHDRETIEDLVRQRDLKPTQAFLKQIGL